jgi:hypothetical protein
MDQGNSAVSAIANFSKATTDGFSSPHWDCCGSFGRGSWYGGPCPITAANKARPSVNVRLLPDARRRGKTRPPPPTVDM